MLSVAWVWSECFCVHWLQERGCGSHMDHDNSSKWICYILGESYRREVVIIRIIKQQYLNLLFRFTHKPVEPDHPTGIPVPQPQHPYHTLGCVFNHNSFFANCQVRIILHSHPATNSSCQCCIILCVNFVMIIKTVCELNFKDLLGYHYACSSIM